MQYQQQKRNKTNSADVNQAIVRFRHIGMRNINTFYSTFIFHSSAIGRNVKITELGNKYRTFFKLRTSLTLLLQFKSHMETNT